MVHRIQNRNTGYSDFGPTNMTQSFTFSNNNSNTVTHGANALKLENEVASESLNNSVNDINNQYHEELLKNQEAESILEDTLDDEEISFTQEATQTNDIPSEEENTKNDLSEFGVDSNSPDLFNNDNVSSSTNDLLSTENDDQEDDLEIPAFLRRQKN